jgi:two-component system response regulator AtoC
VTQAWTLLQAEQEKPLIEVFGKPASMEELIGESRPMLNIIKTVGMLARNRAPILIEGETGTGKDLIARMVHRFSSYQDEPFVVLDCSSVVETLIESELFGYEKGAFTGANRTQKGKIEAAGNGTLFLDEIGELPLHLQGKLLGFLQRHEYMRVGATRMLHSDCRVIAATNRNLAEMVRQGQFKEDLFYRLNVVTVHVPPLRERLSDIPLLVHHFIEKINQELFTGITTLQEGVIERLMEHLWTGNVRELENTLVEACVRARGQVILVEDIDRILTRHHQLQLGTQSAEELSSLEKTHIQQILTETHGNISEASRRLGISRPTLRRKIQKYGIAFQA